MTDEQRARWRQAVLIQRKRARRGRYRARGGMFTGRYLGLQVLPPPRPSPPPAQPATGSILQPDQEGTTTS